MSKTMDGCSCTESPLFLDPLLPLPPLSSPPEGTLGRRSVGQTVAELAVGAVVGLNLTCKKSARSKTAEPGGVRVGKQRRALKKTDH